MKYVYVLLTRTGTMPARFIHIFTGGDFTHASLTLHPVTNDFYSYGRRKLHNPFYAGLIHEDIHSFVFAQYPDCNCAVYAIPVSEESYEKIGQAITYYMSHYDRCRYNFLGMLPAKIGIRITRRYHFTCSQFVAMLLHRAEEVQMPKDPYLMMPNDFQNIPGVQCIYRGKLKDCVIDPSLLETATV